MHQKEIERNNHTYKIVDLNGAQILMKELGKATFNFCGITNYNYTSTGIQEFNLNGCDMSTSKFRICTIEKLIANGSRIKNCGFTNVNIKSGQIGDKTVFKNCIFGKLTFHAVNF